MEKFRVIYSGLYNSASTEADMEILHEKVKGMITPESVHQVSRITGTVVKTAVCSMKARKSDVSAYLRKAICGLRMQNFNGLGLQGA